MDTGDHCSPHRDGQREIDDRERQQSPGRDREADQHGHQEHDAGADRTDGVEQEANPEHR